MSLFVCPQLSSLSPSYLSLSSKSFSVILSLINYSFDSNWDGDVMSKQKRLRLFVCLRVCARRRLIRSQSVTSVPPEQTSNTSDYLYPSASYLFIVIVAYLDIREHETLYWRRVECSVKCFLLAKVPDEQHLGTPHCVTHVQPSQGQWPQHSQHRL